MSKDDFQFEISLSVLNHLGRNLYRNFITVLGEAISNSWDADSTNVWIDIDKDTSVFSIKDDGDGMTTDDFQSKFLKIGYSKRKEGATKTERNRPFIGAKGIGKLALLSCARRVSIFTKTETTDYVGGTIDNSGLDAAIKNDLIPDEYPLENLNFDLISELREAHDKGTIVVFEETKETIRNSEAHIRKLLAMSFKFSLLDKEFNIFVNGEQVTTEDLKDLMDSTEFLWLINGYDDEYIQSLANLKADANSITAALDVTGFIGTVRKPRDLKITGTEERATIDLFVNGRLREKNIIRHIPTQRIVESYIYGQIHFDIMDQLGSDPFTSSREGVVDDDENFKLLLEFLKSEVLPKILDEWDALRLGRGEEGDDENPRKSRKERKARDLYSAASDEYKPEDDAPGKDQVEGWMVDLQQDAEFNISAYVDCFLSENLVRRYIREHGIEITEPAQKTADEWREREKKRKEDAGISFEVRLDKEDLSYLGMNELAICAEGSKSSDQKPSLWKDAISYRPVRNAVGHTGLLSDTAKTHLSVTFENIKARVVHLISNKKK
jgi:hypothetical protein